MSIMLTVMSLRNSFQVQKTITGMNSSSTSSNTTTTTTPENDFNRRPHPQPVQEHNDTEFSACLLVMDDNHFLIEWLSYHYHVLNLRYLVIMVDPNSRTSVTPILDRWRTSTTTTSPQKQQQTTTNTTTTTTTTTMNLPTMTIVEWNDTILFTQAQLNHALLRIPSQVERHRYRQKNFMAQCMKHMKEHGRGWTLLLDSDEFLVLNYDTLQQRNKNDTNYNVTATSISEPGSVLTLLQSNHPGQTDKYLPRVCVPIPRKRFGVLESSHEEIFHQVPYGTTRNDTNEDLQSTSTSNNGSSYQLQYLFNASNFQTLRWRWHGPPNSLPINKVSKAIIHVGRIEFMKNITVTRTIHRPLINYCKYRGMHITSEQSLLIIHHYLGTWEQYSYRDDARKGKQRSYKVRVFYFFVYVTPQKGTKVFIWENDCLLL